jgi:hypothetical protein
MCNYISRALCSVPCSVSRPYSLCTGHSTKLSVSKISQPAILPCVTYNTWSSYTSLRFRSDIQPRSYINEKKEIKTESSSYCTAICQFIEYPQLSWLTDQHVTMSHGVTSSSSSPNHCILHSATDLNLRAGMQMQAINIGKDGVTKTRRGLWGGIWYQSRVGKWTWIGGVL